MYNCGVAGDTAGNALTHMEDSLLFYEPTDVVIAFGMNDSGYFLWDGREVSEDVVRERRERTDRYIENIKELAQKLQQQNIRVSFCTPTPVDEFTDGKEPVYYGVSSVLREMGERLKLLSREFGGNVIDFHSHYHNMLKLAYKEGKAINMPDRIHPNDIGAVLLSQVFLKEQGYDIRISQNYNELENAAKKTFSDDENKRYELEQSKQTFEFVVWRMGFSGIKDEEIIKKEIKKRLESESNEFVIDCYNEYLSNNVDLRKRQEELKLYTKTMSNFGQHK